MKFNQKEYSKKWYEKNKEIAKARAKKRYQENREQILKNCREYALRNPEKYKASRKRVRNRVMSFIFDSLGNKCELCGITNKIILQIDHINGGGSNHYHKVAGSVKGYYKDIYKSIENHENKYRLLCANCNVSEAVRKGFRKSTWIL